MNSKNHKKLEYATQRYERFSKTYSLNQVLPFISWDGRKVEKNYNGNKVKLFSLRLRTFANHGTACVTCGLCGSFFALERHIGALGRYHFNLYGINESGHEILLTKDHILPKAKGGPDSLKNMQTMCIICNNEKGDKVE